MYQNIATKVLTGEVRLTYPALTAPRASQQGGEAKYSVTLLIPKTDTTTYQNILSSIEAAAANTQSKLWNGIRPPVLPMPIHDGDGVRESGVPYDPECEGCWVITASTKNKPDVVDQTGADIIPQDIYSGMYGRVTINFFGYLNNGKKGIGCGLGHVQKLRDGEPLGGGASAAVDFGIVGKPAPAPQYPQYAAPPAPQYAPSTQGYPQQPAYPQQPPAYGGVPAGASPVNPLTGLPY